MDLPDGRLFVGGTWEEGTGAEIVSTFPADGSHNVTLKGASREDGFRAIERAKSAQPAWGALKAHERARVLTRISDGISENIDRISRIQSRDTGKTLGETAALATSAAGTFRYFASVAETWDDLVTAQRGDALTLSTHEPLGLVAAITPWNSPIASDAQKLAPALAAGNAVLLKPASWSPLTALELARICDEAGLPPGLLSVLPGKGSKIGAALVEHPDIAKVSFTGGTATGRALARQAAEKLMPVSLELGGKSPTIVFEDADPDVALAGILFGRLISRGTPVTGAIWGAVGGAFSIAATTLFVGFSLALSGDAFIPAAKLVFVAHIPVMIIEGLLTGFAVLLARKVKPDLFFALQRGTT